MITIEQAGRLRKAGVLWAPAAGDRFVVPDRDMDEDVFVVSDMTVEVHDYQGSKVIGFNGTTEWALDSIEQREVIWLPREEQLRALLGNHFRTLEAVPGGYRVDLTDSTHTAEDAEQAYAQAVIHLLGLPGGRSPVLLLVLVLHGVAELRGRSRSSRRSALPLSPSSNAFDRTFRIRVGRGRQLGLRPSIQRRKRAACGSPASDHG